MGLTVAWCGLCIGNGPGQKELMESVTFQVLVECHGEGK